MMKIEPDSIGTPDSDVNVDKILKAFAKVVKALENLNKIEQSRVIKAVERVFYES